MKQQKTQKENIPWKGNGTAMSDTSDVPALLLTVPQAAQQMSLSPAMIYKLILTDHLPTVKLGRSTRIVYASLVTWLHEREEDQRIS